MNSKWLPSLAVVLGILWGCGGGDSSGDTGGSGGTGSGSSGSSSGMSSTTSSGSSGGNCDPTTSLCGDIAPTCGATQPVHTGDATWYDFADGSGNCSFDPSPNDLMIGAMNHADYAASAACGACALIDGPMGQITIRVVDQCPECLEGDIDLSPEAFAKISPLDAGRVSISWHYVPCNVTGPVVYHFKEGSNQWWTAVQMRNHVNPIAKFEWKDDQNTYHEVQRLDYNYFVEDAGMGPGPYTFRVTDVYGQVIEDSGIPFQEAADVPGQGQFPACGN